MILAAWKLIVIQSRIRKKIIIIKDNINDGMKYSAGQGRVPTVPVMSLMPWSHLVPRAPTGEKWYFVILTLKIWKNMIKICNIDDCFKGSTLGPPTLYILIDVLFDQTKIILNDKYSLGVKFSFLLAKMYTITKGAEIGAPFARPISHQPLWHEHYSLKPKQFVAIKGNETDFLFTVGWCLRKPIAISSCNPLPLWQKPFVLQWQEPKG